MQAVRASPSQSLPAADASKRAQRQTQAQDRPDVLAAKKAEEQAQARATTNTRGETLGRLLNVKA
jgi:hypothetical protein